MTTYDPIGAPTLVEVATLRVRIEDLEAALAAERKNYDDLLRHNQENVAELNAERKAREEAERTVGQLTVARDLATRTAARRTVRAEAAETRLEQEREAREKMERGYYGDEVYEQAERAEASESRLAEVERALQERLLIGMHLLSECEIDKWQEFLQELGQTESMPAGCNVLCRMARNTLDLHEAIRALEPAAEPIAHSKSQYKRLVTQGAIESAAAQDKVTPDSSHDTRISRKSHLAENPASAAAPTQFSQEAAYPSGEDAVTSGQPAPSAALVAHSKSQYRRLVAQGADVAPPAPDNDQPLIEYGYTPSRVNALVQDNDFESTWPAAATDTALPGLELAAKICVRIAEGKGDDPLSDYSDCAHDCAVALRAEITRRKQASNWPFKVLE